jgi:predicted RNA-binding protein with PIN domain
MPVIVDTYNVLHTTGVLPPELAGVDLAGLAALIRSSRYAREQVTLVCDGYGTENAIEETRFLHVAFAGLSRTADDLIAELVARSTAPRLLVVVSSDNQVLRSAKRRGARRLTAAQFLQHLADDARLLPRAARPNAKPPSPVPDDEVARWIDHFDLTEREMSHPAATVPLPEAAAPDAGPQRAMDAGSSERIDEVGDHPSADDAGQAPLLFGDLPDELIREAESLWNRDASRRGES